MMNVWAVMAIHPLMCISSMLTVLHDSLWSLCYDWSPIKYEMGLPLLWALVFLHLDPVPGFLWPLGLWAPAPPALLMDLLVLTLLIFSDVYHETDVQNGSDESWPLSVQWHQNDKLSFKDLHDRHPKSWCLVGPLSTTTMLGSALLAWSVTSERMSSSFSWGSSPWPSWEGPIGNMSLIYTSCSRQQERGENSVT